MAKAKTSLEQAQRRLLNYKFDTSDYIVLDSGVRRDAASGKLVMQKPPEGQKKKK